MLRVTAKLSSFPVMPSTTKCMFPGCTNVRNSAVALYKLPKDDDQRKRWMAFVKKHGGEEVNITTKARLCSGHFSPDCFNQMALNQRKLGFNDTSRLLLINGAEPTIFVGSSPASPPAVTASDAVIGVSLPVSWPLTRDVGCQYDPPLKTKRTVGTQLAEFTLKQRRSKAVQVKPASKVLGTNTDEPTSIGDFSRTPVRENPSPKKRKRTSSFLDDTEESENPPYPDDTTNHPSISTSRESTSVSPGTSIQDATKYIVYEDCLMTLFRDCPACGQKCVLQKFVRGTFLSVTQKCPHCKFTRKWNSQPIIGSTPAGNLHLSAAIYFTGTAFREINQVLSTLKVRSMEQGTYDEHVRSFMEPCVFSTWKRSQADIMHALTQGGGVVTLGGDMQTDGQGHRGAYGSYSAMDLHTGSIIDVQLLQSNQFDSNMDMEKEGLIRSLSSLEASGVTVETLVTSRHPQIQEYLSEQKPDINHFYDVWHVAKGVVKKLESLAMERHCDQIKSWKKSVINHLYWSSSSSSSGDEAVAKWTSLSNHAQNIHSHSNALFPQCVHPAPTPLEGSSGRWLKPASKPALLLRRIVENKRLIKDIAKLSHSHQLAAIDGFHCLSLRFPPKNVFITHRGILCRLYLSAMHFNENTAKSQLTRKCGVPVYKVKYPKYKNGKCFVHALKKNLTFGYVDHLLQTLFSEVLKDPGHFAPELDQLTIKIQSQVKV